MGSVYLRGDLNSRVGQKRDFVVFDCIDFNADSDNYNPDLHLDQASKDNKCNDFGIKSLDLCKAHGLRLVNGRLSDDQNIGNFTYISSTGASVIDYLLSDECNFSNIAYFSVSPLSVFSDHCSLTFSLSCNLYFHKAENFTITKTKWRSDLKDQFRSGIISKVPEFNSLIESLDLSCDESMNRVVDNFTGIYREIADPLFKKLYTCTNSGSASSNDNVFRNAEWFDRECLEAKRRYLESVDLFKHHSSFENRENLCHLKKKYKTLIKQKKKNYVRSKVIEIEGLKSCRPKEFWKYFRHDNNSCRNNLSSDDFFNYFSSLESKIYQCENEEAENFNLSHEFDDLSYFCPELDSRITQSEILAAAKRLQAGKAYGNDDMLNEYFIETIDIIAPHLCDIFNSILDSGIFPKKWCEGIIIPLFEKGDKNCPSNYRGITLLSCFQSFSLL